MARIHEVAEGVFEIPIGFVNAHLVIVNDGVVLVDTGLPGRSAKVEQALHDARKKIGEVHTILLTHWHADHVGGAAHLRRLSGARVVAHMADVPVITGEHPAPMTGLQRLMERVLKPAEPVPVDDVLTADGPTPVDGFSVMQTPGHTAGHVSYLLDRAGGVLFAGDAAAGGRSGRVRRTPRFLTADVASAASSLSVLAGLNFDVAVFGHGRASTSHAAERFRELTSL